jgi:hypothetical protein
MGDRVNVKVVFNNNQAIYLYSHWGGYAMANIVREALARKQRWDDPPYLCRIIFCEMLRRGEKGVLSPEKQIEELGDETGFGIDVRECDPQNPTIVVDTAKQTVTIPCIRTEDEETFSFDDYIVLSKSRVIELHQGKEEE